MRYRAEEVFLCTHRLEKILCDHLQPGTENKRIMPDNYSTTFIDKQCQLMNFYLSMASF